MKTKSRRQCKVGPYMPLPVANGATTPRSRVVTPVIPIYFLPFFGGCSGPPVYNWIGGEPCIDVHKYIQLLGFKHCEPVLSSRTQAILINQPSTDSCVVEVVKQLKKCQGFDSSILRCCRLCPLVRDFWKGPSNTWDPQAPQGGPIPFPMCQLLPSFNEELVQKDAGIFMEFHDHFVVPLSNGNLTRLME